ncbi:hypothetical protein [Bacillus cereus group sp. BfR-BA-01328]|uniref:hypothetical protein n=1 Tax=Bacillus cereus group sp. BfR-BA-01328 TaxID=2920304 RepID=UPI001F56F777
MKFQDDLNHTSLMIEEQKQKGSINLSMKNLNLNEQPISLSITKFKVKKMKKVIYNYLRKMNGANISVFSEYWSFPSKKSELQLSLNEENRWIEIKLLKNHDDSQIESKFYLDESQSNQLLGEIHQDTIVVEQETVNGELIEGVKKEKKSIENLVVESESIKTEKVQPELGTDKRVFQDVKKRTMLEVNKENDRNRIEFKISGQTFEESPVSLCITFPKFSAIQEVLVNYLRKMNKEDVETHGQSWEFAGQHSILLVNLEKDKSLVRVEIEYDNVKKDRYNRGHIYLCKEDIENILNKTSQILSV